MRSFSRSLRVLILAGLAWSGSARALENYVGILGPMVGLGIDSNPNVAGKSYIVGGRFESTTISGHLSVVINSMLGLGVGFPSSSEFKFDDGTVSAYVYIGGIFRYEVTLMRLVSDDIDENATGLYLDLGAGAYYGAALNFKVDGSTVPMSSAALTSTRNTVQVIDPVVNVELKFLLDFDRHFGLYPFFSYEWIPQRNYFKAGYTDQTMKHRFLLGAAFAFEW